MLNDPRRELRATTQATLAIRPGTRAITRTVFAILLVLQALWVASDLLPALGWAVIIAIAVWPIYSRFTMLIAGGRTSALAAFLFTLLTGLVLLVPVALTVHQIAQGSEAFAHWINQLRDNGLPVPSWLAQLPIAGEYIDQWWQSNLSNPRAMVEWLRGLNIESITAWTGALGGALLHRLFLFLVMLIALFPVLRDGPWLAERTLALADLLLGGPGERLASKIADATRSTVDGTAVVAVVEGIVIGVGYAFAGVPHPVLFTVLTVAFAMVPFGAWVAFIAATLILLINGGGLLAGMGLLGYCAMVMLVGDNFLQPGLIGGATRLPFLAVLVGIFGGVATFGLIGLFLGPVIMAALLTVWREWIAGDIARDDIAGDNGTDPANNENVGAPPGVEALTGPPRQTRGELPPAE